MIRSEKRSVAIACVGLMAAGLVAAAPTGLSAGAAPAASPAVAEQAGPFWPGNLLSMNNADFENGLGGWRKISNVSTLRTGSAAFLHRRSLKIVAGNGGGASVIRLRGDGGLQIPVVPDHKGATYRVGAYAWRRKGMAVHRASERRSCRRLTSEAPRSDESTVGSDVAGRPMHPVVMITAVRTCPFGLRSDPA